LADCINIRLVSALVPVIAGFAIIGSASEVGAASQSEAMPSEIRVKLANGQTEILYPFKVEKRSIWTVEKMIFHGSKKEEAFFRLSRTRRLKKTIATRQSLSVEF